MPRPTIRAHGHADARQRVAPSTRARVRGRPIAAPRRPAGAVSSASGPLGQRAVPSLPGRLCDYGRAGASSLLEKVDDVVVGNSHNTIELEGDEAEAAFYVLNVSIDAPSTEQRELAAALRRLRDDSLRG